MIRLNGKSQIDRAAAGTRHSAAGTPRRANATPAGLNLIGASVLLVNVLACSVDDEPPAGAHELAESSSGVVLENEADLNLIAEVELPAGRRVKYFEPEPGSVMELEFGRVDATRRAEPQEDFASRYERLSGRKAPDRLRAAIRRAAEMRAQLAGAGAAPALEERVEEDVQSSWNKDSRPMPAPSWDWFTATYCTPTDRFWRGPYTGASQFSVEAEYFKAGVYTHEGGVSIDMQCTGRGTARGAFATGTVETGWYVGLRCDTTFDRRHSSRVFNADGDLYEHCVNYHY